MVMRNKTGEGLEARTKDSQIEYFKIMDNKRKIECSIEYMGQNTDFYLYEITMEIRRGNLKSQAKFWWWSPYEYDLSKGEFGLNRFNHTPRRILPIIADGELESILRKYIQGNQSLEAQSEPKNT